MPAQAFAGRLPAQLACRDNGLSCGRGRLFGQNQDDNHPMPVISPEFSRHLRHLAGAGLAALGLLAGASQAQSNPAADTTEVRTDQVQARLLAHAPEGVMAGKPVWLGLQLTHQPDWHTYWKNPGDSGQATTLEWSLPPGVTAGEIQWPMPSKFPIGHLANYGYDASVLLPVPLTLANTPQQPLRVQLEASWLVCRVECIPQSGTFAITLPVQQSIASHAALFDATLQQVPQAQAKVQVKAQVQPQDSTIRFEASQLPADWQGKPLNLYPEDFGITQPAAAGEQRWDQGTWQLTVPLQAFRSTSPETLSVVLVPQADTDAKGVIRNAADSAGVLASAPVQGEWPALQQVTGLSPELAAALQAGQNAPATTTSVAPVSLLLALGGALLGGLLLNLMPCVFPVLAIKVMGFARHAHSPSALRVSGIAYTLGVLASVLLLGVLLLALRAAGEQLGWGFQLQNPWMVAGLAALFTLIALNLSGLFEFGQLLSLGSRNSDKERHPVTDAFLSGVLAVVVASPCTAPFMGASMGLAINLPAWQAMLLFALLGLGLALPILLLCLFPSLLRWMPRPGAWMQTFRQLLAFPMLATVLWLVWVLGQQSGINGAVTLLALLLIGSALVWALTLPGRGRWWLAGVFALTLAWLGWQHGARLATPVASTATAADAQWQPWSEARVQQALAAGQPVFVDYTAAWCITCQFNKQTVLSTPEFQQVVQARNVLLLRADWTRNDPAITASLNALGRNGVPVYVLHDPAKPQQPQILTEILRLENVQQALSALS